MKKYFSDRSGVKVPEHELTVLKISRGSPLYAQFHEVHLTLDEAEDFLVWLADRPEAVARVARSKAVPKPKAKSEKPTSPDRPQASI